jgi:hypothetical protein
VHTRANEYERARELSMNGELGRPSAVNLRILILP